MVVLIENEFINYNCLHMKFACANRPATSATPQALCPYPFLKLRALSPNPFLRLRPAARLQPRSALKTEKAEAAQARPRATLLRKQRLLRGDLRGAVLQRAACIRAAALVVA